MSDLVQLTKDNDIAIITIHNPPVNALSPGVPEGIAEAIEKIDKDPGVKAAVLIGSGTTFIAGADIKEFGKITSGQNQRGLTLVPTRIYFKDSRAKVEIALARGKDLYDKRNTIREREVKRDMERAMNVRR